MTRTATDALRRGFDNMLANWPLLFIRFAEGILLTLVAIAVAIAMIVPLFVSIGLHGFEDIDTPEDLGGLAEAFLQRWVYALYIFVALLVLALILVVIHSIVQAGIVRVYTEGERVAGPALEGPRERYRAFTMERFVTGVKQSWLPVFWIYNIVWGTWGLIVLIPLVATIVLMLMFRGEAAMVAGIGCLGILVSILVMIPTGVIAGIWAQKAIVTAVSRDLGPLEATQVASREVRADLGRHVLVALAVIAVSLAGSSFFASFGFMAAMTPSGTAQLLLLPVRLVGSLLSTFFSAATGGWLIGSFAALTPEGRR